MLGDYILRNTDLELEFGEHLDYLKEVIPYSNDGEELITKYVNQYENAVAEGKIRCHCSMDNIRFIVALAVSYEGKTDAEKAKTSDCIMGELLENMEKEISCNPETKKIAEKVYSLLEHELETYKTRFRINEKQIEESLNYMEA
ncbi:MAG: hypothetical protein KAT28_05630 [Candidatus Aenigmarchaeota archaeon]|nr:hypothetical protein [Candidatus Aenigmarchaeota archaeon]